MRAGKVLLKTFPKNTSRWKVAIIVKRTLKGIVAATVTAAMITTATPAPAEAQPAHPPISFQLNGSHFAAIFGALAGFGAIIAFLLAVKDGSIPDSSKDGDTSSSIGQYLTPTLPQPQAPNQTAPQTPTAPTTPSTPAPTMPRFSDAQLRAAERQVIQEINAYRKMYGLRELTWSDDYSAKAREAARKNDGIPLSQSQTHSYGGEVLTRQLGSDLNVAVKQAVQQWIHSAPHRSIIAQGPARNGGAGIHQGKDAEGRDVLYFGAIIL